MARIVERAVAGRAGLVGTAVGGRGRKCVDMAAAEIGYLR